MGRCEKPPAKRFRDLGNLSAEATTCSRQQHKVFAEVSGSDARLQFKKAHHLNDVLGNVWMF